MYGHQAHRASAALGWALVVSALLTLMGCAAPARPVGPAGSVAPPPAAGNAPAASPAAPADSSFSPALRELIEAARQEGSLNLVWGESVLGGMDGAQRLQALINQHYGLTLTLNFTPGPSGPTTATRVVQEVAAGRASHTDIHYNLSAPEYVHAFQPVDWRQYVPDLPEGVTYYDGRGVAYATLIPGITYNSSLVPAERVPRGLQDLLDPWWSGKVATTPYVSGRAPYALPEYVGRERWFALWTAFTKQASGEVRCGEAERLLSGEFLALAIDCGDFEVRARQRLGQPLGHVIPSEGAPMRFWIAGIPTTAAHPNAARLFLVFLLSRAGQEFVWESDATDSYRLPGSRIAEVVRSYEARGVKFLDYFALAEQYPEVVEYEKEMLRILQESRGWRP